MNKREILRCSCCGKTKIHNSDTAKHSLLIVSMHDAQCVDCGHEGIIKVSPHYEWLYLF